ncbi:14711_t:CDS:2, partial [Funneliformis caledonium]
ATEDYLDLILYTGLGKKEVELTLLAKITDFLVAEKIIIMITLTDTLLITDGMTIGNN